MAELFTQGTDISCDNLFAGNEVPVVVKAVTLKAASGVVKRGTVLGIITASALAVAVDSTLTDGAQTANCILTDNVDTGAVGATVDVVATAYASGLFNRNALIFGGEDTTVDHEAKLRELGIFVRDNIAY